jgi:serine/threonine protein kinase
MGRIASQISQLQRVQSPNLVPRHVYEETYGIGYVQMESIDGIDLRRLLTPAHLTAARERSSEAEWERFNKTLFAETDGRVALRPGVVVYILRSVLRGLERLHENNFLHCDIKPGNIMIDRLGYVKVVDFGRAVLTGERISFLLGSPQYMAPETHRREVGVSQSDFYSLGLVALEMLRGETLTASEIVDEEELLKIKDALPDKLSDLLPATVLQNRYLHSILRRFIDPEPDNRHPTAKDAEAGEEGLVVVDKQFAQAGEETEYSRILSDYLAKLIDAKTDRVELDAVPAHESELTE